MPENIAQKNLLAVPLLHSVPFTSDQLSDKNVLKKCETFEFSN